jgi:hypothetical protein
MLSVSTPAFRRKLVVPGIRVTLPKPPVKPGTSNLYAARGVGYSRGWRAMAGG